MPVNDEDVIHAIIGAASAISGFALVFLGFIITARSSYESDTPAPVLNRFRAPAVTAVAGFGIGLVATVLGIWWLRDGGSNDVAVDIAVGLFGVQLLILLTATILAVTRIWK